MRRITLSPDEHAVLESTFKTTTDRRLRGRCQAGLMASRGRTRAAMAQDFGVHRGTLMLWLKHYPARGLDGLHMHWAPGTTRRIPQDLVPTSQTWIKHGPQSCGLDRAHWTDEALAVSL